MLLSVEPGQDLGGNREAAGKIADVTHLIVPAYGSIPMFNHCGIHLGDRAKWPRIKVQHPVVAEMRVADEKDRHSVSGASRACGSISNVAHGGSRPNVKREASILISPGNAWQPITSEIR